MKKKETYRFSKTLKSVIKKGEIREDSVRRFLAHYILEDFRKKLPRSLPELSLTQI